MSARSKWNKFTTDLKKTARDEWNSLTQEYRDISQDARDFIDAETGYSNYSDPSTQSPKRQRGDFGKRGPAQVTPSPSKAMPQLHRRRYGGTRSRRQPYMHGASHRAGSYNPVHFRGRRRMRGRRRKLRWGTKVRKQALGLFEGKRIVKANTVIAARTQNNFFSLTPFNDFVNDDNTATEIGDIKTTRFNGRGVHIRGIKFNLWCFNKTVTHPCIVRVICGWRRVYADIGSTAQGVNTRSIFINTDTKQKARLITETADYERGVTWRTTKAPIDKQAFHVEKDMTFQLGPSDKEDEQNHGNALKQISFWWEMNNRILNTRTAIDVTDDNSTRLKKLSFNPIIHIYHNNAEVGEEVTTLVDYRYDYAIYWKDPLG